MSLEWQDEGRQEAVVTRSDRIGKERRERRMTVEWQCEDSDDDEEDKEQFDERLTAHPRPPVSMA